MTYRISCPECDFEGDAKADFDMSLADEVFCPRCAWHGVLDCEEDDEGGEDDEDEQ